MSNSSRPHGLQPTGLLHPWDFPGKGTGLGCHCLLWLLIINANINEHTHTHTHTHTYIYGLPWWLRQLRIWLQCRRPRFNPWIRKISWRTEWLPTPVFLSGEFHGERSLVGYSSWGHRVGHDLCICYISLHLYNL